MGVSHTAALTGQRASRDSPISVCSLGRSCMPFGRVLTSGVYVAALDTVWGVKGMNAFASVGIHALVVFSSSDGNTRRAFRRLCTGK